MTSIVYFAIRFLDFAEPPPSITETRLNNKFSLFHFPRLVVNGTCACRQAEEGLAEQSVCRHVKAYTRLVVEGKALVGRPRKAWQNTLSADM